MGTRSRIGRLNQDGTVTSIYVHWDGYVEGVGATLAAHYTDPAKIDGLIALGDCSSLHPEITAPEGHTFDQPVKGHTVAYGRDRGEEGTEALTHAWGAWPDSGHQYRYLWDGTAWKVADGLGAFSPF